VHPKEAMNRGLSRAIGYTLVKAETLRNQRAKLERTQARLERKAARLERTQVKLERAQAKLDRTQARLERTQAALEKAKRPAKPDVPRHLDDEAKEIVRAVRDRTMTGTQKVFALIEATRYVLDTGVPGAIVECGVWRGGSMQAVALALLEHLFERVPSGGVVIVDDYGTWKGARRAVDEFLERTDTRLLLVSVGEGRLTLKP
jgi:chromosome segregation ATPase